MVLTPQLFLNMLDAGVAHFGQVALLVSHGDGRVLGLAAHWRQAQRRMWRLRSASLPPLTFSTPPPAPAGAGRVPPRDGQALGH
jgi:hypothetical protein